MSDLDLSRLLPEGLAKLSAYIPPEGNYRVKLDANESPFSPDPVILEEIRKAMEEVPLNRYPDPASRELRSAFANRFNCPVAGVMAGNGSDELIGLLVWTLRGSQGEARPVVIVPTPTFAMYTIAAQAAGYEVHEVPLGPELEPDMEAILQAVREKRPSIVFLSNPNNPTGRSVGEAEGRCDAVPMFFGPHDQTGRKAVVHDGVEVVGADVLGKVASFKRLNDVAV